MKSATRSSKIVAIIGIVSTTAASTSAAVGADATRMSVTDEGAAVPSMAAVRPHDGPVPPATAGASGISQMPGFPVVVGRHPSFAPTRGLVFADLDGQGGLEVIASSTDARVYAWDNAGNPLPGFPVVTIELPQWAPSVADLDGDGDLEIVQTTRGLTSGGRLYAIDHLGNVLPGFPLNVNNNNMSSSPTLYDLDGDGDLEIIVGERFYPIGYLHIYDHDGSEWTDGWPVELDHVPASTAAVGDVDDDGAPEIFYTSYLMAYLLELDGSAVPGWPKSIPNGRFSYQSAALADLDGDDDLEIVVGTHWNAAGCNVFHHTGEAFPGWPRLLGTWTYCAPTVTDLEGDGELEILDGRAGLVEGPSDCFWAWTAGGTTKPGFPYARDFGGSEGPLTVADIDGDGTMEIFADHNFAVGGDGFLFGVDAQGNDLEGFPLRPRGFTYMNGAQIADVDGDGDYELGVLSAHDTGVDVNVYDLSQTYAPGGAAGPEWRAYHARNARGGLYDPAGGACSGDANDDRQVDFDDVLAILAAWGPCPECPEDLNDDDEVDFDDLLLVLAGWGPCD